MNTTELFVALTCFFGFVSAVYYAVLTMKRLIEPVLGTWILLTVMMTLSFSTYWMSPNPSVKNNIGVYVGFFNTVFIFGAVALRHYLDRDLSVGFTPFQKTCLRFGGCIVVFWFLSRDAATAFKLNQGLGILAYAMTVKRLWGAAVATEPIAFWIITAFGSGSAIYPAITSGDELALWYVVRAFPSSCLLVFLIFRINRRAVLQPAVT